MARVVVCGYMIRYPVSGLLLAYFHYVLGLCRLGHEVFYLEESGWGQSCYDPTRREYSDNPEVGLRIVRELMRRYKIKVTISYVNRDTGAVYGVDRSELKARLTAADALLNLGGVCWLPEFRLCRCRVLIDMDPFFTQVGLFGAPILHDHHFHFSYGVNIGRPGCTIPVDGISWRPTLPPVVPEIWQNSRAGAEQPEGKKAAAPFTTVAHWEAYGAVSYRGEHYGQKDEQFLSLLDLPAHCSQQIELALSGASAEVKQHLVTAGWLVRSADEVAVDVASYRNYVMGSRGEFSVAKHAYVKTYSGWFSDRSVCYLAAGLPVILQNTGFTEWLPAGLGVLAFSSLEEAIKCIEKVTGEYSKHRQAARELAEQRFSYKVVLPQLLQTALTQSVS